MADERSLFDRLNNIESTGETNKQMLSHLFEMSQSNNSAQTQQLQISQPSNQKVLQQFLKKSKKSWRWRGTLTEFKKWKTLTIISFLLVVVIGLLATIASSICFGLYSTFSLFEDIWVIFAIIYLIYVSKTQLTYEINAMVSNSSYKFERDNLGMAFPIKEKMVFRIFKWLALISIVCNIICIWSDMGRSNQIIATIMEVLFLGVIIFSIFMNLYLNEQYSIIWVEGHNLATKERVVLVLPPGAKQLMLEEEFRNKMPFFYE